MGFKEGSITGKIQITQSENHRGSVTYRGTARTEDRGSWLTYPIRPPPPPPQSVHLLYFCSQLTHTNCAGKPISEKEKKTDNENKKVATRV